MAAQPDTIVRRNVAAVRARVEAAARRAGRDPAGVTLVAVTKYVDPSVIAALVGAGVKDIGEARVQDADRKKPDVPDGATWHLVGHLQSNKVNKALALFDAIHSLDRWGLVEAIAARTRHLRAFVQVNVGGESTKHGLRPGDVAPFVDRLRRHAPAVEPVGLMTMAPAAGDPRPVFRALRDLALRVGVAGLSMGMSGDFEAAVEEGATHVRIGTALWEGLALQPKEKDAAARR